MELGRINKKMILLCEKTNGLWQKKLAECPGNSFEECFIEVFDETAKRNAEGWRRKENPKIQVSLATWSERISEIMCSSARDDLFEDSVSSSEFSEILGIGKIGRRYLFDVFYSDINKSSISCITFPQRRARDIAKRFGGSYTATFRPVGSNESYVGAMDIRYYMPIGLDNRHSHLFKIRCKLDFPSKAESSKLAQTDPFEYDGYLSLCRDCYTFTMESRSDDAWEQRVISLMVTTNASGEGFSGRYLKNPFSSDDYGMYGEVTLNLSEKHESIVEPHTVLCEI